MDIRPLLKSVILFVGIIISSVTHAAETNGYDCTFQIAEGQQSVRRLDLTLDVYQCLKHSGHRDMIVVNSERQIVPFMINVPTRKLDVKTYKKGIVFYQEPDATTYKTGDQIRRIAGLTGVRSGRETDTQWQHKNTFYSSLILEQKATKDLLKSITINKRNSDEPVSAVVIIESSDDLQHWTTLLSPLSILYLPADGGSLQSNVLKIASSTTRKYLRLAILSNVKDFSSEITAITGEYESSSYNVTPILWSRVDLLQPLEEKGAWTMSLSDLRPVSAIRFTPSDNIVLYQGRIYTKRHINPVDLTAGKQARKDARKKIKTLIKNTVHDPHKLRSSKVNPWVYLSRFTQYEIKTGNDIVKSSDIQMRTTQSKDWKFIFNEPSITVSSQLPVIHVGWKPSQITFIAQGTGPFYLLAGNTIAPKGIKNPGWVVSLNKDVELVGLHSSVSPVHSASSTTGGDSESTPYKLNEILLWAMLTIGVLLMALMAYRLSKTMKNDS